MEVLKETYSICPICNEEILDGEKEGSPQKILAKIKGFSGKILYEKECKEHGRFQDIYWSDSKQYKRAERFRREGKGPVTSRIEKEEYSCPEDCVKPLTGLCGYHKTRTCLGIVDVTNRCNLRCPTCFANAGAMDYVYEPSVGELKRALKTAKSNASRAIQLTGGEPTVRKDLSEIVKAAREEFPHVEVNTNGIRIARNSDLAAELGHVTYYLSWDTVTNPSIYDRFRGNGIYDPNTKKKCVERITGEDLIGIKKRAIDNIEKAGSHVVLVPTIGKSNLDQIVPTINYALNRGEVIRGVNFQPVSLAGRISKQDRVTIPDLINQIERDSKERDNEFENIYWDDWYPVPTPAPMFEIAEHYSKEPKSSFTVHPHCGMATILVEMEEAKTLSPSSKQSRTWVPLPRLLNVEKTHEALSEIARGLSKTGLRKIYGRLKAAYNYYFKFKGALKEAHPFIRKSIEEVVDKRDYSSLRDFFGDRRILFLGIMHFQDPNNIDFERVRRCGIHQAYPDGSLLPFCIVNSGLAAKKGMSVRDAKMRQFGVSWEEYLNQKQ